METLIACRTKGTLGITGLFFSVVLILGKVWHLDVGLSQPGVEGDSKGWTVRPVMRYMSWVQNVVKQFGLYLSRYCEQQLSVKLSTRGPGKAIEVLEIIYRH